MHVADVAANISWKLNESPQTHNRSTSIVTFISLTACLKTSALNYIAALYVASVSQNELPQVLNACLWAGIRKWHHSWRWEGKLLEPWFHQQKNWKAVSQSRAGDLGSWKVLGKMLPYPTGWFSFCRVPCLCHHCFPNVPTKHSCKLECTKCTVSAAPSELA